MSDAVNSTTQKIVVGHRHSSQSGLPNAQFANCLARVIVRGGVANIGGVGCWVGRNLKDAADFINRRPRPLALYYFGYNRPDIDYVLNHTCSGGALSGLWQARQGGVLRLA